MVVCGGGAAGGVNRMAVSRPVDPALSPCKIVDNTAQFIGYLKSAGSERKRCVPFFFSFGGMVMASKRTGRRRFKEQVQSIVGRGAFVLADPVASRPRFSFLSDGDLEQVRQRAF